MNPHIVTIVDKRWIGVFLMIKDMFKTEPIAMTLLFIALISFLILIFVSFFMPEVYEVIGEWVRKIVLSFRR